MPHNIAALPRDAFAAAGIHVSPRLTRPATQFHRRCCASYFTIPPATHTLFAAAKWYGVAAEMGDVGGMVALGGIALKGLGMPANASEALRLFQKVRAVPTFHSIATSCLPFQ